MTSEHQAKQAVRKLNIQPRTEMHNRTLSDLIETHIAGRNQRARSSIWIGLVQPSIRRLVAAGIVVTALLALVYVHRFTAPAYAIEQTVAALQNTSIVHILGRDWNDKQIEMWSKVNPETGLIDHWYIHHIDDEMILVSTPQNTFTFDSRANVARIQEGPSVASFFRLGEFFASMDQLAETFEGQVAYSEVVDATTKQELVELTMSAPELELRSLIDPQTKLPISIDTLRGGKPGPHDTLKHATKISYNDAPPKGVFDFTIPAGATVRIETLEDALADLPVEVVRYCGRVHQEALEKKAEPNGVRANTQIYLVDETFRLRKGGFIAATNDSNDIQTGEVDVANFDLPHLVVFDAASGKKQQIRLVQHRLTRPGRFRLHWTLDTPLRPGQTRYGLYWVTNPQELPKGSGGNGRRLRLSNTFGGEAVENFVLVVPTGTAVCDYSRPYRSREEIGGHSVYLWQRTLPRERVNNTVDLSLSPSGADYSTDYTEKNRGEVLVEIPEIFELANIAIAISEPGRNEKYRVNKQGAYYERVLEHFLPFKDHPVITDPDLARNHGYLFRDNSISYRFEGDRIVHAGRYFNIRRPDLFRQQLALLENFARVSNFRQFYCDNLPYYERQIQLYRRKIPVRRMWTWLEEQFPSRHDCYKIVFSPLLGASHATRGFANGDFSETIMFVSGPGESPDASDPIEQGCLSRVVFTEIDHNYVNHITKDHLDRVNQAFADLGQWNQQDGYTSAELTFNEYMTWAVFVLYAYDTYDADSAAAIVQRSATSTMVRHRKFVRFEEFAQELLRLYRNRTTGQTIGDLYPAILDWAGDKTITRRQAIEDVDFLVEQVIEKHPDPFAQISKEQFEAQIRKLKSKLGEEVKIKDLSLSVAKLLATIRDSHTRHRNFSWFGQHKRAGGQVFPVRFRYQDDLMKVASWSPEIESAKLAQGDIVLSVNGEPTDAILARYGAYISAESDVMRHYTVEAMFSRYQWMLGDACDAYQLAVRARDGTVRQVTLPAVAPWSTPKTQASPAPPLFHYEFYRQGKVCLFKGQSFARNLFQRIEGKTDAVIAEMKQRGTEVLIFDLRNNGGGDAGLGTQLLRKVIDRPYDEFTPDPNAWHGTLVLLCDRWTASAASWLATFVKDHQIGIIAGEETGGAASFYGNLEGITLPHSGLACTVATRHFMRPAGYDDRRGLLPDLLLDVTSPDEVLVDAIYTHIHETKAHVRY